VRWENVTFWHSFIFSSKIRNWLLKPLGGLPTHTKLRSSQRSYEFFFAQQRA